MSGYPHETLSASCPCVKAHGGHSGRFPPCGYTHLEVDVGKRLVVRTTSSCGVLFVVHYCMTFQLVVGTTSHCYDLSVTCYYVTFPYAVPYLWGTEGIHLERWPSIIVFIIPVVLGRRVVLPQLQAGSFFKLIISGSIKMLKMCKYSWR